MIRVSDREIDTAADEIFQLVRAFDSPKDATSVLALAQWKVIEASFSPADSHKAIQAVDDGAALIRKFISERQQ